MTSRPSDIVLFIEPPNWVNKAAHNSPVLYAQKSQFTPLALATVRGMKQTVAKILENSRKKNKKRVKKNIIVDNAYLSAPPLNVNLTPLQIACSAYMGSRMPKYLVIVEALVSFGANIHSASFFHSQPSPQTLEQLTVCQARYTQMLNLKHKCQERILQLKNKRYSRDADPEQRIKDVRLLNTLEQQLQQFAIKHNLIANRLQLLRSECVTQKIVNGSGYTMAISDRQQTNDTELIESMVKGAIIIKESILDAGTVLSEGIVQEIVEYCIGLNLNLWDI